MCVCVWLVGSRQSGWAKAARVLARISVVESWQIGAKRECKLTTGHQFDVCEVEIVKWPPWYTERQEIG